MSLLKIDSPSTSKIDCNNVFLATVNVSKKFTGPIVFKLAFSSVELSTVNLSCK